MLNLLICLVVSVLLLPISWAVAYMCQSIVAKQIRRHRLSFSVEEALSVSGLFITTGLIYVIALCVYLTLN